MSFAKGPAEGRIVRRPGLAIGACFPYGVLHVVGLNPYKPQHRAGIRIDPARVRISLHPHETGLLTSYISPYTKG